MIYLISICHMDKKFFLHILISWLVSVATYYSLLSSQRDTILRQGFNF